MTEERKTIQLIDYSSIGHPIWHMTQDDPDLNKASIDILAKILRLAEGQPNTAICCDGKGSFRKKLDPTYKAQRTPAPETLYHQLNLAIEAITREGFPVWKRDGFEGDDLIASATAQVLEFSEDDVLIVSADKDLLQLVGPRVRVMNTHGLIFDEEMVQKVHDVKPSQFVDFLCICGDKSDNIKGANRIGPRTAGQLLSLYGSLSVIWQALDKDGSLTKVDGGTPQPALTKAFEEFRPRASDVRRLIDLQIPEHLAGIDPPLPVDDCYDARVPQAALDLQQGTSMGRCDECAQNVPVMELRAYMGQEICPRCYESEKARADQGEREPSPDTSTETPTGETKTAIPETEAPKPALETQIVETTAPIVETTAAPKPEPEAPIVETAPPSPMQPATVSVAPSELTVMPDWERSLDPRNMAQAMTLSEWMLETRLFSDYGSPQAVLSTILLGRELGMPAMASLRSVHIIEGKHALGAHLMVGLVLKSGLAEYFQLIESTDTTCTYETMRKGAKQPTRLTHTIKMAEQAGLLVVKEGKKPGNWHRIPTEMLLARCAARLARQSYPDLLLGLYTPDELREARAELQEAA